MKIKKILLISLVAVTLNACTHTQTRRGVTGAALGGVAGLGVSALTGGDVATGALVGAAAGGAIGVSTAPDERRYRSEPRRHYQENNYYYDDRGRRHYRDGYRHY